MAITNDELLTRLRFLELHLASQSQSAALPQVRELLPGRLSGKDLEATRGWVALLETSFRANPTRYASESTRISTAALLLEGPALGWYTTVEGPLNRVVHMWGYENQGDREARRKAMAADPAWGAYIAAVAEADVLLEMENRILAPTPFSPVQ